MNDRMSKSKQAYLPGEDVQTAGSFGMTKGYPHARHERGMKDYRGHLVFGGQVHSGDRADALPVEDYVL